LDGGFAGSKQHHPGPRRNATSCSRCSRSSSTTATPRALLALDFDDKGERIYQHVRPQLEPLRDVVTENGFASLGQAGGLALYGRGI
jgi:hypothetical protein